MAVNDPNVMAGNGFVVLRLRDDPENDAFDDLLELAQARELTELAGFLIEENVAARGRLVTVASPAELRELEQAAGDSPYRRQGSLTQYWRLEPGVGVAAAAGPAKRPTTREGDEAIARLVERLRGMPHVETAYVEPRFVVPGENDVKEVGGDAKQVDQVPSARRIALQPLSLPRQGHLEAAEEGIDAVYAWTRPGGNGATIGFVDLEKGWTLDHIELKAAAISPPIVGANHSGGAFHGTAALGIVMASAHAGQPVTVDSDVRGVVPKPKSTAVVSYHRAGNTQLHVADAVVAACRWMHPGDVLLIEVQTAVGEPIEVDPAAASAVGLACALDRIVVAAAGNGDFHLDTVPDGEGALTFSPEVAAYYDTGSIFVGAARAEVAKATAAAENGVTVRGHERLVEVDGSGSIISGSNYGSRITCYAWGSSVVTCGGLQTLPQGATLQQRYTRKFGGTSSASAIVAGAAVLIQSMNFAVNGRVLKPEELRALLRDPALGTPQVNGALGETIGRMPNLRAIADRIGA